jgi:hypothetical protein
LIRADVELTFRIHRGSFLNIEGQIKLKRKLPTPSTKEWKELGYQRLYLLAVTVPNSASGMPNYTCEIPTRYSQAKRPKVVAQRPWPKNADDAVKIYHCLMIHFLFCSCLLQFAQIMFRTDVNCPVAHEGLHPLNLTPCKPWGVGPSSVMLKTIPWIR